MSDPLARFDTLIHGAPGRPLHELAVAFDGMGELSVEENHRYREALRKPGFREAVEGLPGHGVPATSAAAPEPPPAPAASPYGSGPVAPPPLDALTMSADEYRAHCRRGGR